MGNRHLTLWIALGACLATGGFGCLAAHSRPRITEVLFGLSILCFVCGMFEVPLPSRQTRLRLPKRTRPETESVPETAAKPLADALHVADGLAWMIDQVTQLPEAAFHSEETARSTYKSRLRDAALQLFDSACALGYSPRAERAKIEEPMGLVDNALLLSLFRKVERFVRDQVPPPAPLAQATDVEVRKGLLASWLHRSE
jgi:hypothetical protein